MVKWVYSVYNLKINNMDILQNCKPHGTYESWKNWLADCYNKNDFLATHFPEEYKLDNASKNR